MKKILLIEDIEDNANLVRKILVSKNYEFIWARNARDGLSAAQAHKPDLILLDLGLPDADGQTLLNWLRRLPALAGVPIVACTAWPEETAQKMVAAYGCNGYIPKPINVARFADQITAFLNEGAR